LKKNSRRKFIAATMGLSAMPTPAVPIFAQDNQLQADVVIVGGGLGGCAAALACLRNGQRVIMTEETDWIGGQLTSQGVPPDEHQHIESHGSNRSYRELRTAIRNYYRQNFRLTAEAAKDKFFNPGRGSVSRLCCEPKVAVAVLESLLDPYIKSGLLRWLQRTRPVAADHDSDRVRSVEVISAENQRHHLVGKYFVDATELGDLLPLTQTEFITGAEAQSATGELHAAAVANPANQQAFTICFAVDYDSAGNHLIEKPSEYEFWRAFVPKLKPAWSGKLLDLNYSNPRTLEPKRLGFDPTGIPTPRALNLWLYRRIVDHRQFEKGHYESDISLVNWPQNDYFLGNLVGVSTDEAQRHIDRAKQLSLSLLYWLQTEVPRPDGQQGYPGLRLRRDIMGTEDGLAKTAYVRESRRIKAEFTVLESHVGKQQRAEIYRDRTEATKAASFTDSIGIGSYPIDLHPSSAGDNYIDFETYPFQIPMGALLPIRMENLLPACKNIGTTHLTSGCYRLHPVEWGIGEAVGCLLSYSLQNGLKPREVRSNDKQLNRFQDWIRQQGIETQWA
jgi:FAD dependent oxidoreductase